MAITSRAMLPALMLSTLLSTMTVTLSSGTRGIIVEKPLMPPPWPICSRPEARCSAG